MEEFLPSNFINLLWISMVLSTVVMTFIQKLKTFSFITQAWHIGLATFLLSFLFGIPFAHTFYSLPLEQSAWVALFAFIGAPTLYDALKNQSLLNLNMTGLSDKEEDQNPLKSDVLPEQQEEKTEEAKLD